ncbi:MAG: hypothetical protein RLZZ262_1818 [Bacteroidota bacterium]|jgi:hypothetical protein
MKKFVLFLLLALPVLGFSQRQRFDTTYVKIQSEQLISSKYFKSGAACTFVVVENVYQGDSIIIDKGARVHGTVTLVHKAKALGEPGLIEVTPTYVEGVTQDYELAGPVLFSEGNSRKVQACLLGALISPLFLLLPGQQAQIYPTTIVEVALLTKRP